MHTVSADPGKLWSWGDPSQLGKGQQARIPHIPGWGPPGGMAATGKAGAKNSTAAGEQVSSALTIPSKPHGCFTHNPQFKFQPPPLQRLRGPWRPGCCPQSHCALKERPQGCWQNRSPTRPSARMRSSPPRPLWELGTPHPGRPGRRRWLLGWPCRQSLEKFWGGHAGWVPSCPVGPWPAP